jgi:hypothetical protein
MSNRREKETIGKRLARLSADLQTADPSRRAKIEKKIASLNEKKREGAVIFIPDGMFFRDPKKPGHLYRIDEVNGPKIAVNRISHSENPVNKIPLESFRRSKKDKTTYLQLETIYEGEKGKPIRFNQAMAPKPGTPEISEKENHLANKYARRNYKKKTKWGSKK